MEANFKHVVPLLAFTALVIVATGLAGAAHFYDYSASVTGVLHIVALLLAVAGGGISFLHLGRKTRATRAAFGVSHSWLSREVLLLSLFILFLAGAVASQQSAAALEYLPVLTAMCAAAGLVLCLTIGMVYNLSAQLAWRGVLNLVQPVIGALVIAAVLHPAGESIKLSLISFIIVDLLFAFLRYRRHVQLSQLEESVVFEKEYAWTGKIWMARQGLWAFMVTGVVAGLPVVAAVIAALMAVADRFLLYAGAIMPTPAHRIAMERNHRMEQASRLQEPQ